MTSETISGLQTMSGGEKPLLAGRYRPVRQLGQGGMGSVWLAEDTELDNRKVAIKMLPSMLLSNRKSFQQIKSEALVSLKLTHPNIATLRSFEENGGNPFLVIDYIEGQSLEDVLAERGRLDEAETLALLRPVAAAIDYAHREKVVHRDVKPANVMVRADGTPFVLDFGIAREIQETMTRVTGHLSSGTLMYMSPEQLHGKPPSPAQDVYSFAAMAYECLAGTPPFHRGQIEFQILNDAPPPLPSDSALAQGILRGLAKDPAARPPTCLGVLGEADAAPRRAQPLPPVIRRPVVRPAASAEAAPAAPRAVRVDADVYLLEEEATSLLERTVEKYATSVARDLDAGLVKAKSVRRAAMNALRNGDADAARKLFSEFLAYPAQRTAHATRLALKAFDENRLADAFKCAAEADERDAGVRFLRGYCHQTGEGTPRDLAKARAEYLAAAELGLAAAQFNYAALLHRGEGGDADIPAAVAWYEKAAAKDEADACLALAALYDGGASVPRDAAKAFGFLLKADRLGAPGCAPMLGAFCARNEDTGLSPAARDTYLQAAAAAGNSQAQKILEEKAAREASERLEAERKAEEARREAERLAEESRRAAREAADRRAEEARREAERRAAEAARLEAERRAAVERWAADRAAVRAKRLADLRRIGAKAVAVLLLTVGLAFGGVQAYRAHRRAEAVRQAEAARLAAERAAHEKACSDYAALCKEADDIRRSLETDRADAAGLSNALDRADVALKSFSPLPANVGRMEVSNRLAAARAAWRGLASARDWLAANRPRRDAAAQARRSLDDATTNRLQIVEAATAAPDAWTKLEALRADWRTAFDRGDFAQAEKLQVDLARQTEDAIAAAKRAQGERLLASARAEAEAAYWAACTNLCAAALKWTPDLAEAKTLAEKAASRLGPPPGEVKEFELPGGAKMKFVWCPPGSFTMGSPTDEDERDDDETQHRVTLTKGFWLGQYEVTQAQWRSVMGDNPSNFKGDDNRPVESVSWEDCQNFIEKCNAAVKGVRFALPTEAQWEYACRAGTTGPYAGTGDLDAMGWYDGNSGRKTHPVGQKQPNAWNLYDMHGNVFEWCADCYGTYEGDSTDPTGPASDGGRVLRGGSWSLYARYCRSANRSWDGPGDRDNHFGFRLLCSAGPHE